MVCFHILVFCENCFKSGEQDVTSQEDNLAGKTLHKQRVVTKPSRQVQPGRGAGKTVGIYGNSHYKAGHRLLFRDP